MSCQDSRAANNTKSFIVFLLLVAAIVVIVLTSQKRKETQSLAQIVERVTTTSVETSTTTQEVTTKDTTVLESETPQTTSARCPEREASTVTAVIECPKCRCRKCKVCDSTYVRRKRYRFSHNSCPHDIRRLLNDDEIAIERFTRYLKKTDMYDDFCVETNDKGWQRFLWAKSKQKQDDKLQRLREKENASKKCDYSIHNCGPTCLNYDFGVNK